ncbi:MAG: ABC transporter permease subunit [Oscillospiraceae bacterium]|nr:ABC transporter permease subunit [Oscillospiraceae bacterium]
MTAIFKRELSSYFKGFTGYVYIAFVLFFIGTYSATLNVRGTYPSFEYAIGNMSFIYIIVIPILTMRVFADEKRQKTDQLLYALPVSMGQVVVGKMLAVAVVMVVPAIVSCIYPPILGKFGSVNYASAYGSIIAFFFMGVALASIGVFLSTLTDSQAMSAGMCFLVLLVNYFQTTLVGFLPTSALASFLAITVVILILAVIVWYMTKNLLAAAIFAVVIGGANFIYYSVRPVKYGGLFPDIIGKLSMFSRFDTFIESAFDLTAILYYLTVTALFMFFTVQSLEKRRWS